jgi:hypothetical protein
MTPKQRRITEISTRTREVAEYWVKGESDFKALDEVG